MKDIKSVVDKQVDVLAKRYESILRKNKMIGQVGTLGLSDKIMQAIAAGRDSAEITEIIETFFDERIEDFDKRAGEIAEKEGKSAKHTKVMEDLRGLRGKNDKLCAQAIVGDKAVRENMQYLEIAEKGTLISPELVNKNNVSEYKKAIENLKNFPQQIRPDNMLESKILAQTSARKNSRRILLDSVRQQDEAIMGDYDKMVAHYLLIGGDRPVERFSRVEMSMKQYGLRPDLGVAIMKYGDKLTTKLEELAKEGKKSPKEWELFKDQVLHSFNVAEGIGNRNVNQQEHEIWEERLVRLGILQRKLEKPIAEQETLRESVKVDINNDKDKPSDTAKQGVLLERTMLERAQRAYENTGAIPLGYKLAEDGKTVVSIASQVGFDKNGSTSRDKLSASKNGLSAIGKKQTEEQFMK